MSRGLTIEQQKHHPSREELLTRVHALQALLHENSADGELLRRLPDAISDALTKAGLFRLLTPTRYGGYACDLRTLMTVTEALAEIDGSASWLVAIGANAAWGVSHLGSLQAQAEIFGPNPDVRLASTTIPGTARRAHEGLRISGRWPYMSGAHHADWVVLGATAYDGSEKARNGVFCAVPVTDLMLEKTWYTVGMRATGSDTMVADDVFVPEHRIVPVSAITDETPAREAVGRPQFRLPFATVATVNLVGPLLGLGTAALQLVTDQAKTRPLHNTFFARQSESVGVQIQIAEAAVQLHTARLHAYDVIDTLDDAADRKRLVSYASRAEIRARLGYLAQQVLEAISILINVHGASSFAESSRIQQYWRDANIAARHGSLQPVVAYEVYGKALLGIGEQISALV